MKKIIIAVVIILTVGAVSFGIYYPKYKLIKEAQRIESIYQSGKDAIKNKEYEVAREIFESIDGYRDSHTLMVYSKLKGYNLDDTEQLERAYEEIEDIENKYDGDFSYDVRDLMWVIINRYEDDIVCGGNTTEKTQTENIETNQTEIKTESRAEQASSFSENQGHNDDYEDDEYDVHSYYDAEDFYYDHEDEFEDYEDAEDYFDEAWEDWD